MFTFVDARNRTWTIDLDVVTARQIKSELGIDLIQPEADLLERLRSNVGLLVDLIELLCRPQRLARKLHLAAAQSLEIDAASLTPDDCEELSIREFARSLKGEALERATDAFLEDYLLFCPPHRRAAMQAVLKKVKAMEQREQEHVLKLLDSPQVEATFQAGLEAASASLMAGLSSTVGRASPALTPTPPA